MARLSQMFDFDTARPEWTPRRYVTFGAIAATVITLTSSMRGWPFPSLSSGPWLFQLNGSTLLRYTFLAVFYLAVAALTISWYRLVQLARADRMTTKQVFAAFAIWSVPLFFATPLFSGDVYVYWVDGQLIARGFNPYTEGISAMGSIPMVHMVHPLWRSTSTMYGPIFVRMAQGVAMATPNSVIDGVLVFRSMAIASLFVAGISLRAILRYLDKPVAVGLAFALLNPITMLHLVGGAHNDAMMIGFLMSGLALGLCKKGWGWRVIALGLCALSGAFKIPGFAGALVLGWIWAGENKSIIYRSITAALAGFVALVLFEIQTLLSGLGWGWIHASSVPGLAHPLLSPPNALAMSLGPLFGDVNTFNSATRALAELCAVVFATVLIMRTGRNAKPEAVLRAFAWGLLAIALAGPAVYPWYIAWGVVLAGAIGLNVMKKPLIIGIFAVMFLVSPGGYGFLDIYSDWRRTVISFVLVIAMVAFAIHLYRRAHAHGYLPRRGPKVSANNTAVSENPSVISPLSIKVRS